jgi:hypothetical protein
MTVIIRVDTSVSDLAKKKTQTMVFILDIADRSRRTLKAFDWVGSTIHDDRNPWPQNHSEEHLAASSWSHWWATLPVPGSPVQPGCLNRPCGQKVLPGASSPIRHLHLVQPIWSPDFGPPKVEGGLEFEVTAVTAPKGKCADFDWHSLSE